MNKKTIVISIILVILVGFAIIYLSMPKSTDTKITGVFRGAKGCMGVVSGALLIDFANKCEEANQYEGKTVEVIGHIYEYKCGEHEQCFSGPYMDNIKSIRILE
ncbi:MAG: hypothetical protein AAB348_00140 [Patescibacteria group bacterium]